MRLGEGRGGHLKTSCVMRCDEGGRRPPTPASNIDLCVCFPFSICKAEKECFIKENLLLALSYDMAAKKRKKDLMNNNTKAPCESPTENEMSQCD